MTDEAARPLPDLIEADLKALFCGLNPGNRAAATGHHFEGRQNRFWPVLQLAGFTPRLLTPQEDRELLRFGYGLTTAVARPSAGAAGLSRAEYRAAADELRCKVARWRPRCVAFLGKAAYAAISGRPSIDWGPQVEPWEGARVWVLPNPSGLNRGFTLDQLAVAYRELRIALEG